MGFIDWITAGIGFELGKHILGGAILLGLFGLIIVGYIVCIIVDKFKK